MIKQPCLSIIAIDFLLFDKRFVNDEQPRQN